MHKQTKLDEDSIIFQPRETQSEKEKMKAMSMRQKFEYLIEYYKFHALVTIAVIALIIYIMNSILNPQPVSKFSAAIINNPIKGKVLDQYSNDFAKHLNLNLAREKVDLNSSYNFINKDNYTANLRDVLVARINARELDVIIAPESEFSNYAKTGCFVNLSDQLPTDIYSSLTDKFFITHTEDNSKQTAYGIYLTDTKLIKDNVMESEFKKGIKHEPYIIGIITNTKHIDNTVEIIRYLFNEK